MIQPRIRVMNGGDIPAGLELTADAGWNQTAEDWGVLLAMEPEGCWVAEQSGRVMGSATAIRYGDRLAWIGMVLVRPEARRQGIARALMRHALEWLQARTVAVVKLDASDMGEALYRELGFQDEIGTERWERAAPGVAGRAAETERRPAEDLGAAALLDQSAFGADRMRLLRALRRVEDAWHWRMAEGFVMTRPGSKSRFLGPCVAKDSRAAEELLRRAIAACGESPVYWDIAEVNTAAREMARRLGFQPLRRLLRMEMTLRQEGVAPQPRYEEQYGLAGFEFG